MVRTLLQTFTRRHRMQTDNHQERSTSLQRFTLPQRQQLDCRLHCITSRHDSVQNKSSKHSFLHIKPSFFNHLQQFYMQPQATDQPTCDLTVEFKQGCVAQLAPHKAEIHRINWRHKRGKGYVSQGLEAGPVRAALIFNPHKKSQILYRRSFKIRPGLGFAEQP